MTTTSAIVPTDIALQGANLIGGGNVSNVRKGVELILLNNLFIDGMKTTAERGQSDVSALLRQGLDVLSKSPHETLGVAVGAKTIEIRKAYKKNALKFHPDKNPKTTPLFQVMNAACDKLSDPTSRQREERTAAAKASRGQASNQQPAPPNNRGAGAGYGNQQPQYQQRKPQPPNANPQNGAAHSNNNSHAYNYNTAGGAGNGTYSAYGGYYSSAGQQYYQQQQQQKDAFNNARNAYQYGRQNQFNSGAANTSTNSTNSAAADGRYGHYYSNAQEAAPEWSRHTRRPSMESKPPPPAPQQEAPKYEPFNPYKGRDANHNEHQKHENTEDKAAKRKEYYDELLREQMRKAEADRKAQEYANIRKSAADLKAKFQKEVDQAKRAFDGKNGDASNYNSYNAGPSNASGATYTATADGKVKPQQSSSSYTNATYTTNASTKTDGAAAAAANNTTTNTNTNSTANATKSNANGAGSNIRGRVPRPYGLRCIFIGTNAVELEWVTSKYHRYTLLAELSWSKKDGGPISWESANKLISSGRCRKKNLDPGGNYEFRVRAVEEMSGGLLGNRSEWSDSIFITLKADQAMPNLSRQQSQSTLNSSFRSPHKSFKLGKTRSKRQMNSPFTNINEDSTETKQDNEQTQKPSSRRFERHSMNNMKKEEKGAIDPSKDSIPEHSPVGESLSDKVPSSVSVDGHEKKSPNLNSKETIGSFSSPVTPTYAAKMAARAKAAATNNETASDMDNHMKPGGGGIAGDTEDDSPLHEMKKTKVNPHHRRLNIPPARKDKVPMTKSGRLAWHNKNESNAKQSTSAEESGFDMDGIDVDQIIDDEVDIKSHDEYDENNEADEVDDEISINESIDTKNIKKKHRGPPTHSEENVIPDDASVHTEEGSIYKGKDFEISHGQSKQQKKKNDSDDDDSENPFDDESFEMEEEQIFELIPPTSMKDKNGKIKRISFTTYRHPVRAEPFSKSTAIGYLTTGKAVIATADCGDWLKVRIHSPLKHNELRSAKAKAIALEFLKAKNDDAKPWGWCLREDKKHEYLKLTLDDPEDKSNSANKSKSNMKTPPRNDNLNGTKSPNGQSTYKFEPPSSTRPKQRDQTPVKSTTKKKSTEKLKKNEKNRSSAQGRRNSRGSSAGDTAEEWMELYDEDGNLYYYNATRNESSWDPPEWVEESDPSSGAKYYIHLKDAEQNGSSLHSTWTQPEHFARLLRASR